MKIKPVALGEVWSMRQAVMYPKETIDFVKLEDDDKGMHLGAYENDELISVMSIFEHEDDVQFRKFATRVDQQGKGYGTVLLQYVMNWAEDRGKKTIWCNARTTTTAIYTKFGMQAVGSTWQKYGLEFIKMEKQL